MFQCDCVIISQYYKDQEKIIEVKFSCGLTKVISESGKTFVGVVVPSNSMYTIFDVLLISGEFAVRANFD